MEYVPGIKINKIKALDQLGVDRQRLIQFPPFHLGEIIFASDLQLLHITCDLMILVSHSVGWVDMLLNRTWNKFCLMVFSMLIL